jgi:hypothetical protein
MFAIPGVKARLRGVSSSAGTVVLQEKSDFRLELFIQITRHGAIRPLLLSNA